MSVRLWNQIEVSKVTLEPILARNTKGGFFCKLHYQNQPLMIQTPKLFAPIGISSFDDENKSGAQKFNLMLSLDKNEEFETFLREMKNQIVEECLRHINGTPPAKDWFDTYKKTYKKEVFEEGLMREFVKAGKLDRNGNPYAASLSVKLQTKSTEEGEVFKTTFYDPGNEVIVMEDSESGTVTTHNVHVVFPPKSSIQAILHFDGIWIVDKKVSFSVKMPQCRIYATATASHVSMFLDEEKPAYVEDVVDPVDPVVDIPTGEIKEKDSKRRKKNTEVEK